MGLTGHGLGPGTRPAATAGRRRGTQGIRQRARRGRGDDADEGRWQDVDLEQGAAHIQQSAQRIQGQGIVFRQPKTRLSRRSVALSQDTVRVLRRHRRRQAERRLLAGPAYQDHDLVFATSLGTPLEPGNVRRDWLLIVKAGGLDGLRLHDLRHAHATLMLRAGVHPKVVSERLGHASVNITLDTYSHVLPGLQEAAAEAIDRALDEPATVEQAR